MKTLSILGTGWLGFALAKSCQDTFKVKVSARSLEKQTLLNNESLEAFILNEEDYSSLNDLLQTDYLFINFPPTKSNDYLKFLETIYSHPKIKNIKKVFFISSTSVYPKEENIYKEDLKITNASSPLVYEAEELVKDKTHVLFRCAGLMGEERIAGKYFAGKHIKGADTKSNYIHRDDVINAILFAIEKDIEGIYNLCAPMHPKRSEVYLANALKYGFEKPVFEGSVEFENRIIDGKKLEEKGFKYKYPNPLDF